MNITETKIREREFTLTMTNSELLIMLRLFDNESISEIDRFKCKNISNEIRKVL